MWKNTLSSCKEKQAAGSLGSRQQVQAGLGLAEGIQLAFLQTALSIGCWKTYIYNSYTNKETAIRLGEIRLGLHEQNNTALWSVCSTSKDSPYKLFSASELCACPQCRCCPSPFTVWKVAEIGSQRKLLTHKKNKFVSGHITLPPTSLR